MKQLIKIGETGYADPLYRHSIEKFVEQAEKGDAWRVYPMVVYYDLLLLGTWFVPSKQIAKEEEKDFLSKFERAIGCEWRANGSREMAYLAEAEIKETLETLSTKYPLVKRPKNSWVLYLIKPTLRDTPLEIPQILKTNFRGKFK